MKIIEHALIPFSAAFFGNAGSKILEPVLTSFNNWFYYTFGYKQSLNRQIKEIDVKEKVEKYKIEKSIVLDPIFSENNLKKFKMEIIEELKKIETSKLIVPNKTKLGLFFEDSKFFIDEEEIRKAYARLIAQTANKSKEKLVHKSFGKVLSELAPDDLKILSFFNERTISIFEHYSYNILGLRKEMGFEEINSWNFYRPQTFDTVPIAGFDSYFSSVMHSENNLLYNPLIYLNEEENYRVEYEDDFKLLTKYPFEEFSISLSILERLNLIQYELLDKNMSVKSGIYYDVIKQQEEIFLKYPKPNYDLETVYNELGLFIVDSKTDSIFPSFYEHENSHYLFEINPIARKYTLTNFGRNFLNIIY